MANFIDNLPTYQNYRDSEMECHGSIPSHWAALPNKYIFDLKKDLVGRRSSEYTLLSLTLNGIIKRDMENPEGKFPAEFDTYQEVSPGDFVFCLFDVEETPRAIGLSSLHGMITGAYTVFRPRSAFDKDFLEYFYLNLDSGKRLRFLYKGLRNTISKDVFLAFKTLSPPIHEQRLIARFLSVKTAQIDQAIQIKERQIELLKERKQILIQQAVNRGLNPDAPMRDSGIEWIGEVPAHWEALPSRYLFRVVRRNERDGTEPKLSVTQSSGIVLTSEMQENSTQAESFDAFQVCHEDDLVLNKYKAHLGVFWRAPLRGVITNNYTVFRALPKADSKYYEILFHTPVYQSIFRSLVYGVTEGMMPLYTNDFYSMLAIAPPKIEQIEIVAYINKKSQELDLAIKNILGQIEKLKEYKATLINSAVTGKIKVPGVVEPTEIEEREIA